MPKAISKKRSEKITKKPRKNTGRPVRAAVQAARAATLRKIEEQESIHGKNEGVVEEVPAKTGNVVVDTGEVAVEVSDTNEIKKEDNDSVTAKTSETTETIAAQNVGEAITGENESEYAIVRKNVSSSRLFFVALGTGVLIGVLIFGGLILYDTYGGHIKNPFSSASPSPTPSEAPLPTKVVINPGSFAVQVLNGTGVPGAAGNAESSLSSAGFSKTTTGNAKQYGFTDTEVAMKSSVPDQVFAKIKAALSGYTVVQVTSLPSEGQFDVVVTVGTKKSQ